MASKCKNRVVQDLARFAVHDQEGMLLFAGNYTEVERWLDQQEINVTDDLLNHRLSVRRSTIDTTSSLVSVTTILGRNIRWAGTLAAKLARQVVMNILMLV
jgi:hypothetical protein